MSGRRRGRRRRARRHGRGEKRAPAHHTSGRDPRDPRGGVATNWIAIIAELLREHDGSAAALGELAPGDAGLVPALLGFSAGVEAGPLAIVAALLPCALLVRRTRAYRVGVAGAGSGAVAVIALVWRLQRGLGLSILRAWAA